VKGFGVTPRLNRHYISEKQEGGVNPPLRFYPVHSPANPASRDKNPKSLRRWSCCRILSRMCRFFGCRRPMECGSLLPLCLRARWLAGYRNHSWIRGTKHGQQAVLRESGSKLPHSKGRKQASRHVVRQYIPPSYLWAEIAKMNHGHWEKSHDNLRRMNQREAVVEAMRANGGYATLGHLYKEALKIPGVKWGTKTPFSSINRIVQDPKYFFRIRPGLWALLEAKLKLPVDLIEKPQPASDHAYYQGLLVELGNLRKHKTFVPKQDRGKLFLGRPLGSLVTVENIYPFTYPEIVSRASAVDVIWFDQRKFPSEFIEVENTTDMHGAFLKFVLFDAFNSLFRVVAPAARKREFESKLAHPSFVSVAKRTKFTSYDVVANMHTKASESIALEQVWTGS